MNDLILYLSIFFAKSVKRLRSAFHYWYLKVILVTSEVSLFVFAGVYPALLNLAVICIVSVILDSEAMREVREEYEVRRRDHKR